MGLLRCSFVSGLLPVTLSRGHSARRDPQVEHAGSVWKRAFKRGSTHRGV